MPLRDELAHFVAQRCAEIGISADRLAHIAGVDHEVIENLLACGGAELDVSVAERIANAVGLSLGVVGQRPPRIGGRSALHLAAQTASTSYRDVLSPESLLQALTSGVIPHDLRPHDRTLLEEAPIGLLGKVACELQAELGVPAGETWKRMRTMAFTLSCNRAIGSEPP